MELIYCTNGIMYILGGHRWYVVMAVLSNTQEANTYMETHDGASVHTVYGDYVVLVHKDDIGKEVIHE